jgi:hypothetical protein
MENTKYENNLINKKLLLIILWIALTILSYNGNLIWLFIGKVESWFDIKFKSIVTLNTRFMIYSIIDYFRVILHILPILIFISNLYIKIKIMKYINSIGGFLYFLIYLVSFIYAIQVKIMVEILFYFSGLLITILIIIESIIIIIKSIKNVNKEEIK